MAWWHGGMVAWCEGMVTWRGGGWVILNGGGGGGGCSFRAVLRLAKCDKWQGRQAR